MISLFEASREEYFSTLGAACLENQHTGQEEPAGPSILTYRFPEREGLAKLLFPSPPESLNLINSRLKTVAKSSGSIRPCVARREYPRTRRGQQDDSQGQSQSVDEVSGSQALLPRYRAGYLSNAVSWNPVLVLPRGCQSSREH